MIYTYSDFKKKVKILEKKYKTTIRLISKKCWYLVMTINNACLSEEQYQALEDEIMDNLIFEGVYPNSTINILNKYNENYKYMITFKNL
jgi:hypothetical protein